MTDIVIAAAARTPIGAFSGGLSSLPAHQLGEARLVDNRADTDLSNLDRWYERDGGRQVGDSVIYRVRQRF